MPAPPNTTPETAIEITSLPYSNTQETHDDGTTHPVYYTWVATFTGVISWLGFGNLSTYRPWTSVLSPNTSTYLNTETQNKPMLLQVQQGVQYWFEVYVFSGNPNPATLHVSMQGAPDGAEVPPDAIIIPGDLDAGEFERATIISSAGDLVGYTDVIPPGEQGASRADGSVLLHNIASNNLTLLDAALEEVATVAIDPGSEPPGANIRATAARWYVAEKYATPNTQVVYPVEPNGDIGTALGPFTGTSRLEGIAASPDDTILYYAPGTGVAAPVKRWDIVANEALADLVAGESGYVTQQMVALADGSLVVVYYKEAGDLFLRHYAPNGDTIHTIDIADDLSTFLSGGDLTVIRLAPAADAGATFWVWAVEEIGGFTPYAHYVRYSVSTGAVQTRFRLAMFTGGIFSGAEQEDPPMFGHAPSCPLLTLVGTPLFRWAPPDPSQPSDLCCRLVFVPSTTNTAPTTVCCPVTPTSGPHAGSPSATAPLSATGPILSALDVTTWEPLCEGGGEVPQAADPTDPESWVS